MNARELRAKRGEVLDEMGALVKAAEDANRDLTPEEQSQFEAWEKEAKALEARYTRLEALPTTSPIRAQRGPAMSRIGLGDNENRALAHYIKTGDSGGVRSMVDGEDERGRPEILVRVPTAMEMRAVDSIMNVTTAADGGAAVPTGFSGRIALRRNGIRLSERLGVQLVSGVGTTVNYPIENADPSEFAATTEQDDAYAQVYQRDVAPVLANKAFTLAKKTKKLVLTEELLDDEDANVLAAAADSIGRGIGLTHNTMLITEVGANGTSLKTFAAAAAIATGEPDDLVFHSVAAYYLDDGGSIGWVMRPPTLGTIKKISGNARTYDDQTGATKMSLLEYPVLYSNAAAAIAASAKSLYFGNWWYVGMREDPALRLIRDPYTTDGITYLKYSFRACYGVLIAGAIGYGVHPSA